MFKIECYCFRFLLNLMDIKFSHKIIYHLYVSVILRFISNQIISN